MDYTLLVSKSIYSQSRERTHAIGANQLQCHSSRTTRLVGVGNRRPGLDPKRAHLPTNYVQNGIMLYSGSQVSHVSAGSGAGRSETVSKRGSRCRGGLCTGTVKTDETERAPEVHSWLRQRLRGVV